MRWLMAAARISLSLWLVPASPILAADDAIAPNEGPEARSGAPEPEPVEVQDIEPIVDSPVLETEAQAADNEALQRWLPPAPDDSSSDWIRTTSGEWLRGKLTRMRDRDFDFDSEELDDVVIDQEDVAYFRFGRPHTYRFRGRERLRGTGEMRDGVIKIRTRSNEVVERDAAELVSISRGDGVELDLWSVDAGAGLALRRGNTDQTDLSADVAIKRETAFNRLRLDYVGQRSATDGTKTADNHRVQANLDFFITWRLFVTLPSFEFFSDDFQNIKARFTPGVGPGYKIIENSRVYWDVGGGIGYQRTIFDSDTTTDTDNDAALLFKTSLELEVTSDLDWDSSYSVQLIATDVGKSNHHGESKLSFDVWGPLDFDASLIWDRIESPERDDDGGKPKRDDFRITIGLAIDF